MDDKIEDAFSVANEKKKRSKMKDFAIIFLAVLLVSLLIARRGSC